MSIPLNPNVLAILSKYAGVPPRTITNQRMNKYIKELMLLAGFTERVEVGRTRGGTKETHYRTGGPARKVGTGFDRTGGPATPPGGRLPPMRFWAGCRPSTL